MADIPRTPVFQRLRGWVGSILNPQDGVTGVPSALFPPPPGAQLLDIPRRAAPSSSVWLAPFNPALIPVAVSTDIPRTPNFQPYRDYDRRVGVNAQWWVTGVPPFLIPNPDDLIVSIVW